MADIIYPDKVAGSTFSHEDANEIKTAVNSKVDKVTGSRLITEAESTLLGNTSGENTGDQDLSGLRTKPVTGATFTGEFNLSAQYDKSYLEYACNAALTPTIAAGTNLKGAYNRVVINAGASASLVATNMGTLRAGSDDFTVSKLNEIVIMQEEVDSVSTTGLYYSIKVLN